MYLHKNGTFVEYTSADPNVDISGGNDEKESIKLNARAADDPDAYTA